MNNYDEISEARLRKLAQQRPPVIGTFEVVEMEGMPGSGFYLVVHTSLQNKPFFMASMRKSVRRWSNLNNMIRFVRDFGAPGAKIVITLWEASNKKRRKTDS